ncbi:hypothetical protein [Paenibacillus sp. JJ1722]|uniref:hypothetical protein n=1 Tax=Paenibacillus sp. JJ1722 TaxID=3398770 RepID=UPI003AAA4C5B
MQMNHSPGAPVRLTKEQQEKLKQVIVGSIPHYAGFTARHNWTLEIIAAYNRPSLCQVLIRIFNLTTQSLFGDYIILKLTCPLA